MLRETFRWRKSFDCGFRNNGDLCPEMAPFGQIIGLRQVISEELQNKYDDQLSGKSVFEEFLFHIGFLLLLIFYRRFVVSDQVKITFCVLLSL